MKYSSRISILLLLALGVLTTGMPITAATDTPTTTLKVDSCEPTTPTSGDYVVLYTSGRFLAGSKVLFDGVEVESEIYARGKRLGFIAPFIAKPEKDVSILVRQPDGKAVSNTLNVHVLRGQLHTLSSLTPVIAVTDGSPSIQSIKPLLPHPGDYVTVTTGGHYDANCKIYYDDAEQPTDLYGGHQRLGFVIPPLIGTRYVKIYVKNTATNKKSEDTYMTVVGDTPSIHITNANPIKAFPGVNPMDDTTGNQITLTTSGNALSADSQVYFDNQLMTSTVDIPNNKATFTIPTDKGTGYGYSVRIRNAKLAATSNDVSCDYLAVPGYRGVNGFKFYNEKESEISWDIYRDFFGQVNVEKQVEEIVIDAHNVSVGVKTSWEHRPSAQLYYDLTYKTAAEDGCCFGMSMRSIRIRLRDWQGIRSGWWADARNQKSKVYDYGHFDTNNYVTGLKAQSQEIIDSIMEDQGSQVCSQNLALFAERLLNQDHNAAYDFISGRLGPATTDPRQQPILCIDKDSKKGHAIVAYRVKGGEPRKIYLYDNNKPYVNSAEDSDKSIAEISRTGTGPTRVTDKFSYSYSSNPTADSDVADHMTAYTFDELQQNSPLLPTDVIGNIVNQIFGSAATQQLVKQCTVVVVEQPTGMKQITDEAGHLFFAAGQINTNTATRIPNGVRLPSFGGAKGASTRPAIYIFNRSEGKSLTFDIDQATPGRVAIFSPGAATCVTLKRGTFKLDKILKPEQSLMLPNPATVEALQAVQLIAIQQDKTERSYTLSNIQAARAGVLQFRMENNKLKVQSDADAQVQFNMASKNMTAKSLIHKDIQSVVIPARAVQLIEVPNLEQPGK